MPLRNRRALVRLRRELAYARLRRQIARVEAYLESSGARSQVTKRPILFFNASTRIHLLSLNGAFGLLASWAVRCSGTPMLQVVCERGMEQCVLGVDRHDLAKPPPCAPCLRLSRLLYPPPSTIHLSLNQGLADAVRDQLVGRPLHELASWSWDGIPLGELCLPSLRWVLRRHDLPDDEAVGALFRRYLASAASLASRFRDLVEDLRPRALVVFNGIMYPEAVARAVALAMDVPVITHEVGLQPLSAYFSHQHATFREVSLADGELDPREAERLDRYLEDRSQGRFTMAGIRFWPEIQPLPDSLRKRIEAHSQTVAVFTNVVFDTSQVHANTLFGSMFEWLNDLRQEIDSHPETLFVLRAHPDEDRPGKESRQSVAEWMRESGLLAKKNVAFFGPQEPVSSYELIRQAKLILVYNSSIGLEGSIAGVPVLCAGRARYTQLPTVFFPSSRDAYRDQLQAFLNAVRIDVPPEFAKNARRFLAFELFHASLDFSEFLEGDSEFPGMVQLKLFDPRDLSDNAALSVVRQGILEGTPFVLPSNGSADAA